MNGFIKRTIAVICVGSTVALSGCWRDFKLCDYYDNCWPERYAMQARQPVHAAFAAQVNNGHVLDQTVFGEHFEQGTDKLTKGGQDHLAYMARRRPVPDTTVYLQTAQDVSYDPAAAEQYARDRNELDSKRVQAIQRFLQADTAGRPISFNVVVHDAPSPGLPAQAIGVAIPRFYNNFQGVLPAGSTGGSSGGAGGASSGGGSSSGGGGTSR